MRLWIPWRLLALGAFLTLGLMSRYGSIGLLALLVTLIIWAAQLLIVELSVRRALKLVLAHPPEERPKSGLPIEAAINANDRERVQLLAVSNDQDAFLVLLVLLQSPDREKRILAAYGLGLTRNPRAVPALIKNCRVKRWTTSTSGSYADGEWQESTSTVRCADPEADARAEAAIRCGERARIPEMLERELLTVEELLRLVDEGELEAATLADPHVQRAIDAVKPRSASV